VVVVFQRVNCYSTRSYSFHPQLNVFNANNQADHKLITKNNSPKIYMQYSLFTYYIQNSKLLGDGKMYNCDGGIC